MKMKYLLAASLFALAIQLQPRRKRSNILLRHKETE